MIAEGPEGLEMTHVSVEGGYFHCPPDLVMTLNVPDQAKGKGAPLFAWMHGMPAG